MMTGWIADGALQKHGISPSATGVVLMALGVRAMMEGEAALYLVAAVLVATGAVLVNHDLRRRKTRLVLSAPSPEGVVLYEPDMPVVLLRWEQLSMKEPSIRVTLMLLAFFLGSVWGAARLVWELAVTADMTPSGPGNALVAVAVWTGAVGVIGTAVVERTQWVELNISGRRSSAFFAYRQLQQLGILEGLKKVRKIVEVPLEDYVVEELSKPTADETERKRRP